MVETFVAFVSCPFPGEFCFFHGTVLFGGAVGRHVLFVGVCRFAAGKAADSEYAGGNCFPDAAVFLPFRFTLTHPRKEKHLTFSHINSPVFALFQTFRKPHGMRAPRRYIFFHAKRPQKNGCPPQVGNICFFMGIITTFHGILSSGSPLKYPQREPYTIAPKEHNGGYL